jgi:hypothetical protein
MPRIFDSTHTEEFYDSPNALITVICSVLEPSNSLIKEFKNSFLELHNIVDILTLFKNDSFVKNFRRVASRAISN